MAGVLAVCYIASRRIARHGEAESYPAAIWPPLPAPVELVPVFPRRQLSIRIGFLRLQPDLD
jgi:hypothetical protein